MKLLAKSPLAASALMTALLLVAATGAVAGTQASRCSDRLPSAAIPAGEGARLAELHYDCVILANDRALWVGQGGQSGGDAVLLVHGLGNNAHRDWRNVVPQLVAQRFRVIAIDLPGFGASQAPADAYSFVDLAATLNEVLQHLQVEKAHVVGHSLGGALSLYFAWAYPQSVDRLVLVDVAGILQQAVYVRYLARLDTRGASGLGSALKSGLNGLGLHLQRKLERGFDFSAWLAANPDIRNSLLGERTQIDAAITLAQENFTTAIRETRLPVTLIWGRDDPIAPLRTGLLLAARLPNARLHVIDDGGHVPMNAAPEQFNESLTDALLAPLPQPLAPIPSAESHGDLVCKGKANVRYTGHFNSLRLSNCANIRIEDAEIGRLQIDKSTAELYNVKVANDAVAFIARGSTVTGTAVSLQGAIAIRADNSELDIAGASLRASRRAVHLSSSARIYFSVSDIQAPDYTGDAHGIWTRDTVRQLAKPRSIAGREIAGNAH